MGATRIAAFLSSLTLLLVLSSCGSSGGSLPLASANTLPASGLPAFPQESGERSAAAEGSSQTVNGADFIQQLNSTIVQETQLKIGPSPAGQNAQTAYGMYRFSGLSGMRLQRLDVSCLPQNIQMKYFVALADFTNMTWKWFGPISMPEFSLQFENASARFISPLGNVYMLVATHEQNSATHSHSTLHFGTGGGGGDDPAPPGAPTNLWASDGTYPNGVKLEWQAGEAAQWHRVFRALNSNPNGGNGEWQFLAESEATNYFDSTASPGVVYLYKVQSARMVNNQILHSAFSNVDSGFAGGWNAGYVIEGTVSEEHRVGTIVVLLGKTLEPVVKEIGNTGSFRFDGLQAGNYIVYPYNPNHQFEGNFKGIELGPNNPAVAVTFQGGPIQNPYRAWGFIYSWEAAPNGVMRLKPQAGVGVKVRKDGQNTFRTGESGMWGFYQVFENEAGVNIVEPFKEGWQFTPTQQLIEISGQHLPPARNFRAWPPNNG